MATPVTTVRRGWFGARCGPWRGAWILAVLTSAWLAACAGAPASRPQTAEGIAWAIVDALARGDVSQLGEWVHPEQGVRFSPYAYVDPKHDQILTAAEMKSAWIDDRFRVWGSYDGTGDPIELTFRDYVDRFVYDADFSAAEQFAVGKRLGGHGGTIDNTEQVYPRATTVEFHLPGTERNAGMDWRSLRLVLEQEGGDWWLVGIVHDEWTT